MAETDKEKALSKSQARRLAIQKKDSEIEKETTEEAVRKIIPVADDDESVYIMVDGKKEMADGSGMVKESGVEDVREEE